MPFLFRSGIKSHKKFYLKTRYRSRVKFLRFEISHKGCSNLVYTSANLLWSYQKRHHFSSTNLCLVILSCIFEWIDLTNLIGSVEVYSITISVLFVYIQQKKKNLYCHIKIPICWVFFFFLRLALYIFKPIFISKKYLFFERKCAEIMMRLTWIFDLFDKICAEENIEICFSCLFMRIVQNSALINDKVITKKIIKILSNYYHIPDLCEYWVYALHWTEFVLFRTVWDCYWWTYALLAVLYEEFYWGHSLRLTEDTYLDSVRTLITFSNHFSYNSLKPLLPTVFM